MSGFEDLFDRFHAGDRHDEVLGTVGKVGFLVLALLLAVAGVALRESSFLLFLLSEVLIFALFAISLDFVFGYAGLPSFGHAAMFGTGGYAAALLLTGPTRSLLVVLTTAFLVGTFVAVVIGWLSVRSRGVYFAMLTLAFAQVLYILAFNDVPADVLNAVGIGVETITGGDNGIVAIPNFRLLGMELDSNLLYYYMTLVVVVGSIAILFRLANSPFGRVVQGIRENEDRIDALGYNVTRYKVVAFAISGGFSGAAGGLMVPLQTLAHPQNLHWQLSGELIVMVLLGGMGTLWGPMLGAALVIFLEDLLSSIQGWRIVLALLFIVVVIFAPDGIAGTLRTLWNDPRGAVRNGWLALVRYADSIRG